MQNRCKFLLAKKVNLQLDNNSVVKIEYNILAVFYLIGVLIKVTLSILSFFWNFQYEFNCRFLY